MRVKLPAGLWLVPMALALFIGVSGCGTNTVATAKDPFAQGAHGKVGDAVMVGSRWTVTITKAATSTGQNGDVPGGGHLYLVVSMSFTNRTSSAQSLYTIIPLTLRDAAGNRYTQQSTTFTTPPDGTVDANATATGDIVFEVPQADQTFQLAYVDDTGSGQAVWDLSI